MHPQSRRIVAIRVDATSYAEATRRIVGWARRGLSRYLCAAPVSTVMQAYDDPKLQGILEAADLVTPDGMPLVWGLRLLGIRRASRVYGPDLMLAVLEAAAREAIPVGFYGGTPAVLDALLHRLLERYPGLRICYCFSPPFRPLLAAEEQRVLSEIAASGTRILLVGIGSPQQERWMAEHRGRVEAVMLGVGAAFDFVSGAKPQAPRWMRNSGLEWLFRLATEPRRLWKRYLKHNPRFVVLFAMQLLGLRGRSA